MNRKKHQSNFFDSERNQVMIDYKTFHVVDHPLIKHKLSIMRM